MRQHADFLVRQHADLSHAPQGSMDSKELRSRTQAAKRLHVTILKICTCRNMSS